MFISLFNSWKKQFPMKSIIYTAWIRNTLALIVLLNLLMTRVILTLNLTVYIYFIEITCRFIDYGTQINAQKCCKISWCVYVTFEHQNYLVKKMCEN